MQVNELNNLDLEFQHWPEGVDFGDDVGGHGDEFGVVAGEAVFSGPFVGAIKADFAAKAFGDGGVVELVYGATGVEGVAAGVAVGTNSEEDFAEIVDIDIFIEDVHELGETESTEAPDGVHDFVCMAGIFLLDFDEGDVVEGGFDGEVHVHDFGDGELDHGEENSFDGFAHPSVFHGRLPDDGGGVDGFFAHCDGGDVKDRELSGEAVVAGVVTEGAFELAFVGVDIAFDDEFAVGGDFDVYGFAFDGLDAFSAEESGEEDFVNSRGEGGDGGEVVDGVSAEADGDFDAFLLGSGVFHVAHSGFVHLPVHAAGVFAVELNAVHANVAFASVGIVGEDEGEGDEGATVFGPAGEDWKFCQVDIVAGEDDFLAECVFDRFGGSVFEFEKFGKGFESFGGAVGDFWFEEGGDAFGVLFIIVAGKGEGHPFAGAHGIDGNGIGVGMCALGPGGRVDAGVIEDSGLGVWGSESVGGADGVLEEEGGALGFHDSICDFGDFEVGGERFGDDLKFVFGFEGIQEVLVVAVGHQLLFDSTRLGLGECCGAWV